MNRNIGAIILAGGLGNRLISVGPKPFLLYQGKSFLEIAVENTRAIACNPVIIVTNQSLYQRIIALNFPVKILLNLHPEQGMLSSIIIGVKAIENCCSGFFLCPIDYPQVQRKTYLELLSAHQSFPTHIIKPIFNDRSGHPIVIPQHLFRKLQESSLENGTGVITTQYSHFNYFVKVNDPGILININTPALYYQYCK